MRKAVVRDPIIPILILALAARIAVIVVYGDPHNDYYWEYGEIARSMLGGDGYSYFSTNSLEPQHYSAFANPAPSAYMPPGYVAFLLPFMGIDSPPVRNISIYAVQTLLALLAIGLLFRLTDRMLGRSAAVLTALIAALLPEFLYAVLSFTPTVLYHLLVVLLFLRLLPLTEKNTDPTNRSWDIGLLLALLIYLRSEMALFALLLIGFCFVQRRFRRGLVIGAVTIALLLPWSIRNAMVFDTVVPMTTSFGLNLYRGNNTDYIGSFGTTEIMAELRELDKENFEPEMNALYREYAFDYIAEHPERVPIDMAKKIVYLTVFDPHYAPSRNLLYAVPNVLLSLLAILGLIRTWDPRRYRPVYLWLFSSLAVILIFFALPRYGTMMKILTIPFASAAALDLYTRIARKRTGSGRNGE